MSICGPRLLGCALTLVGLLTCGLLGRAADPEGSVAPVAPLPATANLGGGTGFVVDRAARLLLTNYHVAGKLTDVALSFPMYKNGLVINDADYHYKNAAAIYGKVRYADPKCDLALIELGDVPDHVPELALAGQSARTDDRVVTAGNPGARVWVVEKERVGDSLPANFAYEKEGQKISARLMFTKGAPYDLRGSSGSPVVNEQGELVGVVTGVTKIGPQQVRLCIDVSEVRRFLEAGRHQMELQNLPSASKRPEPPRKATYRADGTQALRQGDYARAVSLLSRALQIQSRSAATYHERAVAQSFLERPDEAIADYSSALKLDPTLSRTYRGRATAHYGKGNYAQAIADCNEAIRLDPKYAQAYLSRSKAHAKLNQEGDARRDYTKAIQLDPSLK